MEGNNYPEQKWTKQYLELLLKRGAAGRADEESLEGDTDWSYRKAAAVLTSFVPLKLKPLKPPRSQSESEASLGQLVSDSRPIYEGHKARRWMLRDEVRREALKRLGSSEAMRAALRANKSEDNILQSMFNAYITRQPPPVEKQTPDQLASTLQVIEWLDGILDGLPDRKAVRQNLERANLLNPFRYLAGEHFRGRKAELQILRDYVGVLPPGGPIAAAARAAREFFSLHERPPLLVHGMGGIGKSTLISRFVLDHAELDKDEQIPFAYIDFDRPGTITEEPIILLIEAVRQLAVQYPGYKSECETLISRWSRLVYYEEGDVSRALKATDEESVAGAYSSLTGEDAFESVHANDFYQPLVLDEFAHLVGRMLVPGRPLLFVLDTFEEVQYYSRAIVSQLWSFLNSLQERIPRLRVVVVGRALIPEFRTENLALSSLDTEAAIGYLQMHGIHSIETARALVDRLGGNPLTLKLAVELLHKESHDIGGIRNLQTRRLFFLSLKQERIQGELFRRILGHIHDPDVRKLAHPGLVLRRVTPALIKDVLSVPCRVEVKDMREANRLFRELQREVSLVAPTEDGALRYRPDVRQVMISLLKTDEPHKVEQIHRAAIEYYKHETGIIARAEEIYHRLSLGQSPRTVDAHWQEGVENYLASSLEELPAQSQAFLASRLDIDLDDRIFSQAELEVWERHADRRARKLLDTGEVEQALELLRERSERTPGSAIYPLEAQALEQLQRYKEAVAVATAGKKAASQDAPIDYLVELYLLLARLYERLKEFSSAQRTLREVRVIARSAGDSLMMLGLCINSMRVGRISHATRRARLEALDEAVELFNGIPEQKLLRQPKLVRDLATEVGEDNPEVFTRALRLAGFETIDESRYGDLKETIGEWNISDPVYDSLLYSIRSMNESGVVRAVNYLIKNYTMSKSVIAGFVKILRDPVTRRKAARKSRSFSRVSSRKFGVKKR